MVFCLSLSPGGGSRERPGEEKKSERGGEKGGFRLAPSPFSLIPPTVGKSGQVKEEGKRKECGKKGKREKEGKGGAYD